MSRIGRLPVAIPAGVEVTVAEGNVVTVKGPKGTLERALPTEMEIKVEDGHVVVSRPNDLKKMKSLHGLTRSLIHNMVVGVSEGYQKTLEVNGVGYKAAKQGKKLVLFGSLKITDKRKGVDYLIEACKLLAEKHPEWKESLGVVVFGNQSQQLQEQLPFHVYPLPYIKNEHEIVNIYNAVDLFAIPSLEENLPNMIMEAMACGVPCVGFNVGGIPEMIDHLHNGYVAQYKSSEDFANGIHWILTEPEYDELSAQACRKVLGNYSESIIAKKYTDVYNKITGKYA